MTPKNFVPFSNENAERTDYQITPEKWVAGESAQSTLNMFSDPGNEFHCGIWEGAPALWRVSYSEHEFCHILQGRIRITDEDGTCITVAALLAMAAPGLGLRPRIKRIMLASSSSLSLVKRFSLA